MRFYHRKSDFSNLYSDYSVTTRQVKFLQQMFPTFYKHSSSISLPAEEVRYILIKRKHFAPDVISNDFSPTLQASQGWMFIYCTYKTTLQCDIIFSPKNVCWQAATTCIAVNPTWLLTLKVLHIFQTRSSCSHNVWFIGYTAKKGLSMVRHDQ